MDIMKFLFLFVMVIAGLAGGYLLAIMVNKRESIPLSGSGRNPLARKTSIIYHTWPKGKAFPWFWTIVRSVIPFFSFFFFSGWNAMLMVINAWVVIMLAFDMAWTVVQNFPQEETPMIIDRWYTRLVGKLNDPLVESLVRGGLIQVIAACINTLIFIIL